MKKTRIQLRTVRRRAERHPVLALDPRDPDVARAKAAPPRADAAARDRAERRAA
ncbi:MAG: hypothetical protein HY658_08150 [Actinobacteria bacterium]|nr:hypothetical protein [Actinomycetota bacterium]